MRKFKFILCSIIFSLGIFLLPVNAAPSKNTHYLEVEMYSCSIPTDYRSDLYQIRYESKSGSHKAYILSRKTYSIVATYEEIYQLIQMKDDNTYEYITLIESNISLFHHFETFQADVIVVMKVEGGSYWRQCKELMSYSTIQGLKHMSLYELGGLWTFDATPAYPATKVNIDINGTIASTRKSDDTRYLSPSILNKLGFQANYQTNNTHGFSSSYNTHVVYNFMK